MTDFPTSAAGLSAARRPEMVHVPDGGTFDLRIAPVAKRIGDETVRMLAYNGSIPGPTLVLREGSEIVVNVENPASVAGGAHVRLADRAPPPGPPLRARPRGL